MEWYEWYIKTRHENQYNVNVSWDMKGHKKNCTKCKFCNS